MRSSYLFRKCFIHTTVICVALLIFCSGCKKSSFKNDDHFDDQFFKVSNEQPELIKKIAARIKLQNRENPFVAQLSRDEGYPLWDNSEIVTEGNETRVYIPLVLEKTEYVNAYILYRQKGSYKSMDLIRGRTYGFNGFAPGAASHTIAGNLIRLNYLVFGKTRFLITDKRLFGLTKIPDAQVPFLLEYKPQTMMAGAEQKTSVPQSTDDLSLPSEESMPVPDDGDPSHPCLRFFLVSNCGVNSEGGGPDDCPNIYIIFYSSPCTEPPSPDPVGPGGTSSPTPGGTGGSSGGLPGLNITMPPCPTGMSQSDCDALMVPVLNYIERASSFSDLNSPVEAPEEPIIQNGIDVEDIDDAIPPGTIPRHIAHTRPRGNVEDMRFGTTGDVSGINASLIPLPDETLFATMSELFSACTVFDNDLQRVGILMIEKFRNRNQDQFENPVLNQKVSQSASFINFVKKFGDELRSKLQQANGNIDAVVPFETRDYRPVFNGLYNKFHGLQILLNDTEFTSIEMDKFYIDTDGNWNAIITVTIYDHFGLDKNDALTYQRYHNGFAAWWLLQHTRGYTPFQTAVKIQKVIKGKI